MTMIYPNGIIVLKPSSHAAVPGAALAQPHALSILNQITPTTGSISIIADMDLYSGLGAAIGKSISTVYGLDRGVCILGPIGLEQEPKYFDEHGSRVYPGHKEIRKIKRKAQREIENKKKRVSWQKLKELIDKLDDCNQSKGKGIDGTCIDMSLQSEKQSSSDGYIISQEEQKICSQISELLEELGENGILRFFHWVIREIGDEITKDPELRELYLIDDKAFTRNRAISLSGVFMFLMTMGGDNMNSEVYEYFKNRQDHPSASAMIQQRGKLSPDGVEYLMNRITALCRVICEQLPRNMGLEGAASRFGSILACDGSSINICLDPENQDTYVEGVNGKRGYNQYHLNSIRDAVNGLFIASKLQGVHSINEVSACVEMIRSLTIKGRTLFTADRGYGSLNLIETIRRKENLECLIRVKENWITEIRNLPLEEFDQVFTVHVVTTQRKCDKERFANGTAKYLSGESKFGKYKTSKTWDYDSECDVTFRVVRFQLKGGAWETLVTTLDAEEFSIEDLKELYFLRWGNIETSFRVLKWDNHLSQMHCKRDDFARQEIFARLAMYNLISCIICIAYSVEEAAHVVNSIIHGKDYCNDKSGKENKYQLIINRRFATYLLCDFLKNPDSIQFDVIEMMLRFKSPVRKGRSYKRDLRTIGFRSFFYR
jgi:hypothetical protein